MLNKNEGRRFGSFLFNEGLETNISFLPLRIADDYMWTFFSYRV